MKRTDADGNVANLFFDGNPNTGDPATVVEQTWLNNVQEEICNVIEDAGIVLDENDQTQLLQALGLAVQSGSFATNFALGNNQVAAASVTGLLFNKVNIRSARIPFVIHRQTDLPVELDAAGVIVVWHKPLSDSWQISVESSGDDHGITFSITSGGQVQYVSTNETGANYAGQLRISGVQQIKV